MTGRSDDSTRARRRRMGVFGGVVVLSWLAAPGVVAAEAPLVPLTREVIGHSVRGRPLTLLRLGAPTATHKVLVVGAIHGDEGAGRAIVDRLTVARSVPVGGQLLLVRSVNPDGVLRGTRLNAHRVDLNRNSADRFGLRQPAGSAFPPGPRAFSEPETRALRALLLRERPDAVVWYHQPLGLVDLPEVGTGRLARGFARAVGLPVHRLLRRPGSMSAWTNTRVRAGSSWVVELGPGRLAAGDILRHAAALRALAAPPG